MLADQLHARLTVLEGLVMGIIAQSHQPEMIRAVAREHVANVLDVLDGDLAAANLATALRHQLENSLKSE